MQIVQTDSQPILLIDETESTHKNSASETKDGDVIVIKTEEKHLEQTIEDTTLVFEAGEENFI